MPLTPIGDIGTATLSETTGGSITWETATDWDNAADQGGVVHDTFGDSPGDNIIKMGWSAFDTGGSSLNAYWHFDEASGATTWADVVSGYDMSVDVGDPTAGATGDANTKAVDFDGNDGLVRSASDGDALDISTGMSVVAIINMDNQGELRRIIHKRFDGGGNQQYSYGIDDNNLFFQTSDNSFETPIISSSVPTGSWATVGYNYDPSNQFEAYLNGSSEGSTSVSSDLSTQGDEVVIGYENGGNKQHFDGRIAALQVYSRLLTDQEHADKHAAIDSGAYLESATKSTGAAIAPNLSNLTYSLNGETIDLKVIGSPGEAGEEVVTQTLDGASNYSLTWSNTHTDFRVRPEFTTTDPTTSPTFSAVTLSS